MSKHWGKQTELTVNNFKIKPLQWPDIMIETISLIKWSAAKINGKNNKIDKTKSQKIQDIAWKIWKGDFKEQFPLSIWQSGSGTQTNMNVNEVIANLASDNNKYSIHPNNDVNYGQSTNDVLPTAIQIAAIIVINKDLKPAINKMIQTFEDLTQKFGHIIKPGRTHFQDATLISYKQEWSGYIAQLQKNLEQLDCDIKNLSALPLGGTAVGTGINTYLKFDQEVINLLSQTTDLKLYVTDNKFRQIAAHDDLLNVSSSVNTLATIMNKIANDFRFLTSGPNCGINEILFPANEAGSSIMAGKVNPTQCEMLSMVALHAMGSFYTINQANNQSHLQLNTYNPLIAYHLINSIEIMSSAINSFNKQFLQSITINEAKVSDWVNQSKMLSTILVPVVGYDNVKKIIDVSNNKQCTILQAVIDLKLLTEQEAKQILDPKNMIKPSN